MIATVKQYIGTFISGAVFATVGVVVLLATDRKAPFEIISVIPGYAKPGDTVTITARVRRDVDRNCSATFSRYIFDAASARHDLGQATATADTIRRMERRTPGLLIVSAAVPLVASPGPAVIETALEYQCNVVHALWPITVTAVMPFTIL